MKKKKAAAHDVVVEEKQFDAVLAQMLKKAPMPMKTLKTRGRKGPKSPIIPARKSES